MRENNDMWLSTYVTYCVAVLFVVVALDGNFAPLGIFLGIVVGVLVLSAIYTALRIVVIWMRQNAETHTDEWRQERLVAWIMKDELPPTCRAVGHEYEGGKCLWCDALDPNPNGCSVEEFFEWSKGRVANLSKVPSHYMGDRTTLKPHFTEDGRLVALPIC